MSSEELLYAKGSKVWLPNAKTVWESATLNENYRKGNTVLKAQLENGTEVEVKVKPDGSNLPPLRNPAILIGQNDLTSLSYLHEPGVLHNLRVRFCERQTIYTYCGIVLVAINPYAELPLYGSSIIRAYRGRSIGELEPHIFALSEEAYTKLEREKCNLSIIVSGESGAGKTVSAKYAMRYFAAVGGSESETQVERKVLASSPIMEAFGNAKTTRNDNSSRFGKFTKLLFKNNMSVMNLTGATMHTYLLEKSRVVFQALGERNYHIFYQLCAARKDHPQLILDHQDKFEYLNMGKSPDIDKVSDRDQFKETIQAMLILGFDKRQISDVLNILAGILHLGNLKFSHKYKSNSNEIDPDGCQIDPDDLHLRVMGELLKINADDLRKWLKTRQIESVNELVLIPNNLETAMAARDALAKHIYAKLFQYIVSVLNKGLNNDPKHSCFIGVLDIYGFETFDVNSFEQFCINYANEKLQQQFNQHVFKLEQEEYLKEGIAWTMIDFYDNQPCIDLIESKLGVLDLLDEECRMPRGSDESWARKLVEKCNKFPHFEKPRFGNTTFFIKHFSDTVEYDVNGFLEKNRDTVSKELVNVIRQSKMSLCKQLMEMEEIDTLSADAAKTHTLGGRVVISAAKKQGATVAQEARRRVAPSKQHRRSVGSQFRDSLTSLINTLHSTTPHYVRCIKPNEEKIAFKWDAPKIVQQLRACGVLETVRISAAGFPSRWLYLDFYMRYQLLCHRSLVNKNDLKQSCCNIVSKWITDEDKYRFGNTQIFFRAGQVAYLEQIRANLRKKYITIIQSVVRRFICRKRFVRLQSTVLGIQRYARGYLARQRAQEIREQRAAIVISKYARGYLCRRRYLRLRRSVCGIQQYARGMLARKRFQEALDHYRATQIQRFLRGYLARREYHKRRRQIIICQSAVRRFMARRQFKLLKAEAKTISHMENLYKGLENKIISMQQRIDELNRENGHLKHKNSEISVLKMKLEMKKAVESELKNLKLVLAGKDEKLTILMQQLEEERDEKMQLLEENANTLDKWNKQKEVWTSENSELRKQIDEMLERAKQSENKETSAITQRERLISEVESNEIHDAYRKALMDKEIIENENYHLKEELKRLSRQLGGGEYASLTHHRSISNGSSHNEDDVGYASAKNTLEHKGNYSLSTFDNSRTSPEPFRSLEVTSTPRSDNTVIVIKLRNLLEEATKHNRTLRTRLDKAISQHRPTEDSLRVSELEVENEKLRHDYNLLRQSIRNGAEMQELEAQHNALQEELKRRREECIQLKTVLQQQTQSLKSLGNESLTLRSSDQSIILDNELNDAYQAQKLVNKQLECELKALTEENNAHFAELSRQLDELRQENAQLQEVFNNSLDEQNVDTKDPDALQQSNRYLKYELKKTLLQYSQVQEELNATLKKYDSLKHRSDKLTMKLQEQGAVDGRPNPVKDETNSAVNQNSMVSVGKQKAKTYQGLMKFRSEDLDKIFHRLVVDMSTRVAIGLLPGFPAYVLFMCIRYTDLINADEDVRELLSKFVKHIKKIHRNPSVTEYRILWLVNSITLLNLLKQYGDVEEYVKFNTEKQNQQQLKNFNLYEYRRVILEIITKLYEASVKQIEGLLEGHIVEAILDNDEIQRGHQKNIGGRVNRAASFDNSSSPEHGKIAAWKQLISQLEHFFKQFLHFGLDRCYSEQIFTQLMYFICAIAMNCLMLRGDKCMWETGMIIRYNLGHIEEWVKDKAMSKDVLAPLAPLNQVSQLLQSRKSEKDVQSICDLCTNLNTAQVLKIMKSYKLDDYEGEITNTFLEKLTEKLNAREMPKNDEFTMDQKFIYPFKVVFKYSDIKLEDIEIPKHLGLDELLQKI
ncbi:unconventional myosin-Va isoform X1 [Lucilia cuprina]|uniref:unconventional myosin-Va isoform X1 n=1 Tax=Lucilia cuprina TaxID=7375 RepID=UPI001F054FBF|nr:unconventional myosin-Va isoform X1 [Lucilia cuprina]